MMWSIQLRLFHKTAWPPDYPVQDGNWYVEYGGCNAGKSIVPVQSGGRHKQRKAEGKVILKDKIE
jgi:hypothetical protein